MSTHEQKSQHHDEVRLPFGAYSVGNASNTTFPILEILRAQEKSLKALLNQLGFGWCMRYVMDEYLVYHVAPLEQPSPTTCTSGVDFYAEIRRVITSSAAPPPTDGETAPSEPLKDAEPRDAVNDLAKECASELYVNGEKIDIPAYIPPEKKLPKEVQSAYLGQTHESLVLITDTDGNQIIVRVGDDADDVEPGMKIKLTHVSGKQMHVVRDKGNLRRQPAKDQGSLKFNADDEPHTSDDRSSTTSASMASTRLRPRAP